MILFFLNGFLNKSMRVLDPCQGAFSLTEGFEKSHYKGTGHVLFTTQKNLDSCCMCVALFTTFITLFTLLIEASSQII